jgi:hypothetical protein
MPPGVRGLSGSQQTLRRAPQSFWWRGGLLGQSLERSTALVWLAAIHAALAQASPRATKIVAEAQRF